MALTSEAAKKALAEAREKLKKRDREVGKPAPAEDLGERFPTVDPIGSYGVVDMEIKQRMSALKEYLRWVTPPVQSYVNRILNTGAMAELVKNMQDRAREERELTAAIALAEDPSVKEELERERWELRKSPACAELRGVLDCLEYEVGRGSTLEAPPDFTHLSKLGIPPEGSLGDRFSRSVNPRSGLKVEVPNLEAILEERHALYPSESGQQGAEDRRYLDRLCEELGRQSFGPFTIRSGPHLEERVLIGNRTGRELLEAMDPEKKWTWTEREKALYRALGAALISGKTKIDVIPCLGDLSGNTAVSDTPVPVNRSAPAPENSHVIGLLDRILAFFGIITIDAEMLGRDKAAKAEEERRSKLAKMMAALQEKTGVRAVPWDTMLPGEEENTLLREGEEQYYRLRNISTRAQKARDELSSYLPNIKRNPRLDTYRIFRETTYSMTLALLCAEGHPVEEIMDPTKLVDEKKRAGRRVAEMVEKDLLDEFACTIVEGTDAMMKQMEERLKQVDLTDDRALRKVMPAISFLSQAIFNHTQELQQPDVLECFLDKRLPQNKKEQLPRDQSGKLQLNKHEKNAAFNEAVSAYENAYCWGNVLEAIYSESAQLIRSGLDRMQRNENFAHHLGMRIIAGESAKILNRELRKNKTLGEISAPNFRYYLPEDDTLVQNLDRNQTPEERAAVAGNILRGKDPVPGLCVRLEKTDNQLGYEYSFEAVPGPELSDRMKQTDGRPAGEKDRKRSEEISEQQELIR